MARNGEKKNENMYGAHQKELTRPVQAIATIRLIFNNLINTKIEFFVNESMSNSNLAHINLFSYNLFMGHLPYCHRMKRNWISSGRWAQFRMIMQNGGVNGDFTCLISLFFLRRSILVSRANHCPFVQWKWLLAILPQEISFTQIILPSFVFFSLFKFQLSPAVYTHNLFIYGWHQNDQFD